MSINRGQLANSPIAQFTDLSECGNPYSRLLPPYLLTKCYTMCNNMHKYANKNKNK